MKYYADEVIKPLLDRLIAAVGMFDSPHSVEIMKQSEWQLALEDLLWISGREGIKISDELWCDLLALDAEFEWYYESGVRASRSGSREAEQKRYHPPLVPA